MFKTYYAKNKQTNKQKLKKIDCFCDSKVSSSIDIEQMIRFLKSDIGYTRRLYM